MMKNNSYSLKITTHKLCALALLTAATVILSIFGTFRVGNQIKIPLKFLTVFLTGALYGPIAGGLVGAAGDILNAVLVPVGPLLPQITAVEFLYGAIFGLFFFKAENNGVYYIRAAVCSLLQFLIGITVTTYILVDVGYFSSFGAAVIIRLPAAIATLAMHIFCICIMKKLIFAGKRRFTLE